ncbi:Outer membrane lipoprotein omp16 precursor [hydrothermal vent metagenome]|uniref:Outer membrane lipoprotein omp16 n=1 Tax=hydrothermal vent metagenome TaxID=652676 RepID=A0A3B0TGK8_9ZZZZ
MKKIILLITISVLYLTLFAQDRINQFNDLYLQNITVEEIPANSVLSDFGPSLVNGSLYLTSNNESNTIAQKYKSKTFYDLYSVDIDEKGEVLSTRKLIEELVSEFHVGPCAYNKKTKELFITKSNASDPVITPFKPVQKRQLNLELVIAKKIGGKWKIVKKFNHNNKAYSVAHPAFTPSGDTLIFVSDMPGGYGETDLYMSVRLKDGWSIPKNLGSRINTPGKEFTPFVTSKGILIYASDGFEQGTGLNLYFTVISNEDDPPIVKFPSPINSKYDDFGMVVAGSQIFGYFTSNRPGTGSDDIYRIDFNMSMVALSGKVINKFNRNPINNAKITFNPSVAVPETAHTDKTGFFKVEIPIGKLNEVTGSKPGFKTETIKYNREPVILIELMPEVLLELSVRDIETKNYLTDVKINFNNEDELLSGPTGVVTLPINADKSYYIRGTHPDYLDNSLTIGSEGEPGLIKATLWMYKGNEGKTFVLENIYYDFDKWDILPQSAIELDKVVRLLNENPGLKVEISSHTDARGTLLYNDWLAKQRSHSAVSYIESKGIDGSRIKAKGYGERDLYIPNAQNEVEHRLNRRTTFTIKENSSTIPKYISIPSNQSAYGRTATAGRRISKKTAMKAPVRSNITQPDVTGLNYRVQFYASVKPVNINSRMDDVVAKFSKYGIINQVEDNLYKYQVGPFTSKSQGIEVFENLEAMGYQVMLLEYNNNSRVKMLLP